MPNYPARLQAVQTRMAEQGIDLLFLSRSANLHYVTGIGREEQNFGNTIYPGEWLTGAWISQTGAPILTLPRMLADFHMGAVSGYDVRVLPDTGDPADLVRDVLDTVKLAANPQIAVEDRAWAELVLNVQRLRPQATISQASALLMPLRVIKDEDEIAIMRKAGEITEAAYQETRDKLHHGMTTLDLMTEVNYQLKKHGATTHSFVTSFYNMGKHHPFDFHNRDELLQTPLDPPVSISFDFGAVYEGYCYDYGRSVFFGEPDAEYRKVYGLVIQAQAAGIAALCTGNICEQVDAVARGVIAEGGYGAAFRHRLGHAIGMDVHETPFLMTGQTSVLRPGMCFTVEPSIFIPHHLGARVEDIVVVRAGGGEALTSRYKTLHVVN